MREMTLISALITISMLVPCTAGFGPEPTTLADHSGRDTRAAPQLNFTYLNHDGSSFGSTAFRVWDDELVIFAEAFPNETYCIWNPGSIRRADIILQAPHGHSSHYDPDEVACVAINTGAYVVGNNALHNDMIARGVDSSKIVELNPALGKKVTKSIPDLKVTITSYGMEHTWMSGVQVNTFLVEMPSGIKWYHGTCSSGTNTENYMANAPELKGLDVMLLDFDLIKPSIFNTFYPDYVIKDHDYQTFQATIYNHKQKNLGTLSHNQTFRYNKVDHPPEVVGMEFSPLNGDRNTEFTFTATYNYWYDRPAERAELFLDGAAIPLKTTSTSGFRTGVQYTKTMMLSEGDHLYHLEFEVDSRTVRVPTDGDLIFHVNHIPELISPAHDPVEGDTDTIYRFSLTYRDPEGRTPQKTYIMLDGTSRNMNPQGLLNYTAGVEYSYSTKLSLGDHSYRFMFSDGVSEVTYPAEGYINITVARANYAPVLSQGCVDSPDGSRKDLFTFSVRYKDVHADKPTKELVIIDGQPYNMTMVGTDVTKGVEFRYQTGLGIGTHNFHFEFSDGRFEVRFPAEEGAEIPGPVVRNLIPKAVIYSPSPNSEHSDRSPIKFNASGTYDGDTDPLNIDWSSDLDGHIGKGWELTKVLSAGTHLITLTVDDGLGGTDSANISIVVVHFEPKLVPELSMRPASPKEGEAVTVTFKLSNNGNLKGENITLTLLLDGTSLRSEFLVSLLPQAYKTFTSSFKAASGEHQLLLRTTSAPDITMTFEVPERAPPVANAGEDIAAKVGEVVQFDASRSTSSGMLTYFHWDFDDGSNATGRIVDHIFMRPGTYNVTLTVKDDLGKVGSDHLKVSVSKEDAEVVLPREEEDNIGTIVIAITASVLLVLLILAALVVLVMKKRKKEASPVQQSMQPYPPVAGQPLQGSLPMGQQSTSSIDFLFAPRQPMPIGQPSNAPLPMDNPLPPDQAAPSAPEGLPEMPAQETACGPQQVAELVQDPQTGSAGPAEV